MFLCLLFPSDRHTSSSVPEASKSQLGMAAASDVGHPRHTSSPDRGLRKRASSEADRYKSTPPHSYKTAMKDESASSSPSSHMTSYLDADVASTKLTKMTEKDGEQRQEEKEEQSQDEEKIAEVETHRSADGKDQREESQEQSLSSTETVNSSTVQGPRGETGGAVQHTGTMNGSLIAAQEPVSLVSELHCSVEQAEEIMGTEATGLGIGVGLGLVDESRLEDYRCIPVDHAVAVECDEQVLGELDVAGFEEFSRRIYALNENMSSFRRPRKNSDKWGRGATETVRHSKTERWPLQKYELFLKDLHLL